MILDLELHVPRIFSTKNLHLMNTWDHEQTATIDRGIVCILVKLLVQCTLTKSSPFLNDKLKHIYFMLEKRDKKIIKEGLLFILNSFGTILWIIFLADHEEDQNHGTKFEASPKRGQDRNQVSLFLLKMGSPMYKFSCVYLFFSLLFFFLSF